MTVSACLSLYSSAMCLQQRLLHASEFELADESVFWRRIASRCHADVVNVNVGEEEKHDPLRTVMLARTSPGSRTRRLDAAASHKTAIKQTTLAKLLFPTAKSVLFTDKAGISGTVNFFFFSFSFFFLL